MPPTMRRLLLAAGVTVVTLAGTYYTSQQLLLPTVQARAERQRAELVAAAAVPNLMTVEAIRQQLDTVRRMLAGLQIQVIDQLPARAATPDPIPSGWASYRNLDPLPSSRPRPTRPGKASGRKPSRTSVQITPPRSFAVPL